ncbi:CAP domain-containing protein [Pelomonas sp. KK5]|uniref:CAP domain-containing protein n=1 Tax=Pelomonas sp. KK5 TaxID=1855730 RepID=UPI00117E65CB|nr:CAP domain-containing protein [Pelomonas sp. KK5]
MATMKEKNNSPAARVLILLALSGLSACGGGGGGAGDSSTGIAAGASAGATSGTSSTDTGSGTSSGSGTSTGSTVTTTAPGAATEAASVDYLNLVRAGAGAGALGQDEQLSAAARSYSAYVLANPGEPPHQETEGHAGYTGVLPGARVTAASYTGQFWTESSTGYGHFAPGAANSCVPVLLNTMYNMAALLGPAADVGIGYKVDASAGGYCVLDMGYKSGLQLATAGRLVSYPYPGQSDAMPSYLPDGEQPRPPAALTMLIGQPIYASMVSAASSSGEGSGTLETFELRDAQGQLVPAFVLSSSSISVAAGIETLDDSANAASHPAYGVFLVPKSPLVAHASYTATFAGHFNGVAFNGNWSFTTRSTF